MILTRELPLSRFVGTDANANTPTDLIPKHEGRRLVAEIFFVFRFGIRLEGAHHTLTCGRWLAGGLRGLLRGKSAGCTRIGVI